MEHNNLSYEELLKKVSHLEKKLKEQKSKKYGLVWEEHPEQINQNAFPMLEEVKEREIHNVNEKLVNLLIEGDNFHSLKSLSYTHKSKIDVIYIDPPYNTGNRDFKYNDKFVDNEDGWRHSKWLSFMSKRLEIAKSLLSSDGIILISIDDNEFAQLKLLCDEVFGMNNFIGNLIWKCRTGANDSKTNFSTNHEYILCYANGDIKFKGIKKDFSKYKNPDNDPNGRWMRDNPSAASGTEKMRFPITNPYTAEVYYPPEGRFWAFSEKSVARYVEKGKMVFPKTKGKRFTLKKYLSEVKSDTKPNTSLDLVEESILTLKGTKELKSIFNGASPFKYPKPSDLLIKLLDMVTNENSIILDFFAGSGTTAHAVLKLNEKDNGNRQFILCTNNENNICELITYERIKKIINGYKDKNKDIQGIKANLKYYKTKEIGDVTTKQTDREIKKLVKYSTELLKIKNNTFENLTNNFSYDTYISSNLILGVLKEDAYIEKFIEELKDSKKEKKIVYAFSWTEEHYNMIISEISNAINNVEFKSLPEDIMKFYRSHYMNSTKKLLNTYNGGEDIE